MTARTASASGKIILAGEYAMALGYPGIAVPSEEKMLAAFRPAKSGGLTVIFGHDLLQPEWAMYAGQIAEVLARTTGKRIHGELTLQTNLPLGKGMGSSTALVIAIARALLGPSCRGAALAAEDEVNPGHSGMDFAVIWEERPIRYVKGEAPKHVTLPPELLRHMQLTDTGMPNEQTPALVAWVKSRAAELKEPLQIIGGCADRILKGESLRDVVRAHHRAQVALGVVPPHARAIIEDIESRGGAAKVIGAGGRTGGGGMVLSL